MLKLGDMELNGIKIDKDELIIMGNEIKDNMKNMIGFDSSKLVHKINLENSSRIKFKRTFIGKNKFFKMGER